MANQVKRGSETARVLERHGMVGYVRLSFDCHPDLKDALVDLAEQRGWSFKDVCCAALNSYVERCGV